MLYFIRFTPSPRHQFALPLPPLISFICRCRFLPAYSALYYYIFFIGLSRCSRLIFAAGFSRHIFVFKRADSCKDFILLAVTPHYLLLRMESLLCSSAFFSSFRFIDATVAFSRPPMYHFRQDAFGFIIISFSSSRGHICHARDDCKPLSSAFI